MDNAKLRFLKRSIVDFSTYLTQYVLDVLLPTPPPEIIEDDLDRIGGLTQIEILLPNAEVLMPRNSASREQMLLSLDTILVSNAKKRRIPPFFEFEEYDRPFPIFFSELSKLVGFRKILLNRAEADANVYKFSIRSAILLDTCRNNRIIAEIRDDV